MTPAKFVEQLSSIRFENSFNPYNDKCSRHDRDDAPRQRALTLQRLIERAQRVEVDSLWVGRDLGHRGGRRTGLALTDDVHFHAHLNRWQIEMERPTIGRPLPERTAGAVWDLLARIDRPIFLWNVFPFHPHLPGDTFSNRTHNAKERDSGIAILSQLIALLRPRRLIAVGNDSEKALIQIADKVPVIKVRHPSYGGQRDFSNSISDAFGLAAGPLL